MNAIETTYKDHRFRSRLEARWAVFYDELGVQWSYEKEGYVLDGGVCYLPDFWMPGLNCYIEIKGDQPDECAITKAKLLAEQSGHNVYIFWGDLRYQAWLWEMSIDSHGVHNMSDSSVLVRPSPVEIVLPNKNCVDTLPQIDRYHWWVECHFCGRFGIDFFGRVERLPCGCVKKHMPNQDHWHGQYSDKLQAAYKTATEARFEHNCR